jgi:hypothetical protein
MIIRLSQGRGLPKRFFCAVAFALCVPLLFSQIAFGQAAPDTLQNRPVEEPPVSDAPDFVYRANQRGDQFLKINLMVDIPIRPDIKHLQVGGTGTLSYMRFLNSNLMLGGELGFGYNVTVGSNVFTFVPMLFKASYQFTFKKFEFPVSLGVGMAFENYLTRTYFGPAFKPEIGAYWRVVPEWSFGIHYGMYFLPQFYSDTKYNYLGIIQDLGISGRYHF